MGPPANGGLMKYLILCFAFILAGCVTPYQPDGFRGGYSEQKVGNDIVAVSFRGNGYTSATTVANYVMKRASEYCEGQGSSKYELVNWTGDHETSQGAASTRCNTNGQMFGNYYSGTANCQTTPGMVYTKHEATLYIRCINTAAH